MYTPSIHFYSLHLNHRSLPVISKSWLSADAAAILTTERSRVAPIMKLLLTTQAVSSLPSPHAAPSSAHSSVPGDPSHLQTLSHLLHSDPASSRLAEGPNPETQQLCPM
uniref:Uncharacterized protein n=1 Tax=Knipowitschia caucasica TaxID=637954 RepID=A0AAV2KWE2_KNICA